MYRTSAEMRTNCFSYRNWLYCQDKLQDSEFELAYQNMISDYYYMVDGHDYGLLKAASFAYSVHRAEVFAKRQYEKGLVGV